MDLDSSDLDLNEQKYVGLRFQNIEIPNGSTITNAYVQFTTEDDKDSSDAEVRIFAQDSDDSQTFTNNDNDISSRTKTSASVDWDIPNWEGQGSSGTVQQTPDISSLIQEVIERDGWVDGNSIVIIIQEQSGKDRDAYSFDDEPSKSAVLHISTSNEN